MHAVVVVALTAREAAVLAAAAAGRWLTRHRDGRVFAAVTIACLLLMTFVDPGVARWARQLPDGVVTVFKVITNAGKSDWWLYVSAAFAGLALAIYGSRAYAARALFFFAGIALSGIAVNLLKVLFGRARPKLLHAADPIYGFEPLSFTGAWQSFPSGHASTAVAAALCAFVMLPRLWPLWLALALVISVSRVVVGAHYPADLVGGAYVTVLVVLALRTRFEARGCGLRIDRGEPEGH